jgi:hypothetical protein
VRSQINLEQEDGVKPTAPVPIPVGLSPSSGYLGDGVAPPERMPGADGSYYAAPVEHSHSVPSYEKAGALPMSAGASVFDESNVELSLCGHLFRRNMDGQEAAGVFDAHRVSPDSFWAQGAAMVESDSLVLRIDGVMYPWAAAAPMVLGRLAFGGGRRWDALIRPGAAIPGPSADAETDAEGNLVPLHGELAIKPATDAEAVAISSQSGGGWRLWPFGSWRGTQVRRYAFHACNHTLIMSTPLLCSLAHSIHC